MLYFIIRVRLTSERSWPTSPAECQVEPLVSSLRSKHDDVLPAHLGEVIGDTASADAAADDDDREPEVGKSAAMRGLLEPLAPLWVADPLGRSLEVLIGVAAKVEIEL